MELEAQNASLKEQLDRVKHSRKRKNIPNPNKGFMKLSDAMAIARGDLPAAREILKREERQEVDEPAGEESDDEGEAESESDDDIGGPATRTRAGREVKRPRRLDD